MVGGISAQCINILVQDTVPKYKIQYQSFKGKIGQKGTGAKENETLRTQGGETRTCLVHILGKSAWLKPQFGSRPRNLFGSLNRVFK
jgi:hypothetical protein